MRSYPLAWLCRVFLLYIPSEAGEVVFSFFEVNRKNFINACERKNVEKGNKRINGLEVLTISHTFDVIPEAAFLVKVDGLVIFYSGDHGSTKKVLNPLFKDNIDYFAGKIQRLDIAFISQFGPGDLKKGDLHTIETLNPRITFPMHQGRHETQYLKFAKDAEKKGVRTTVICAEKRAIGSIISKV